jgi:hypothetical protein
LGQFLQVIGGLFLPVGQQTAGSTNPWISRARGQPKFVTKRSKNLLTRSESVQATAQSALHFGKRFQPFWQAETELVQRGFLFARRFGNPAQADLTSIRGRRYDSAAYNVDIGDTG